MKHRVIVNPMANGDIQAFDIYNEMRPNCSSKEGRYYIKKEKEVNGEWVIKRNFYVGLEKNFSLRDENSVKYRYKNQVGYISCTLGFIYQLLVNEIPECAFELSTVLTTLCMIDPELNRMDQLNYSFNKLEADNPMEFVSEYCEKLIGVSMSKNKRKKAYAYISAALGSGYTKMLVKGEKENNYVVLDLNIAEKAYDSAIGNIRHLDPTWNNWIFCKE